MVKMVTIKQNGGPDVLEISDQKLPPLKNGEVLVKQSCIGINHLDIEYRRGIRKLNLPSSLGFEACGVIEAIKGDVGDFKISDRVAYALAPIGAYTEMRNISSKYLVPVPYNVKDEDAAAILFKGMTAHYLVTRTFLIQPKMIALVSGAAGCVSMILTKMIKYANGIVIGTVGSDEKAAIAKANGCDYVINYKKEDIFKRVKEITNNEGVNVVYDAIGKSMFNSLISCIRPFGLMVSYGSCSGILSGVNLELLRANSIFLTIPSLFKYRQHRIEMALCANDVFDLLARGVISSNLGKIYEFEQIGLAHKDVENGLDVGAKVIKL